MGPPPQPEGLRFSAPWPWVIGDQKQSLPNTWWIDAMEGGESGLRFALQFDPAKAGFDRTLLGVSLSTVFSRLLGWSKNGEKRGSMATTEEGGESAAAAVSISAAAAVAVILASLYRSDRQPRRARPRRWMLASAMARQSSVPRALPASDDGLRILASKDESLENVIHGASIGTGDDEPDIVARVEMETTQPDMAAGANAADDDETEDGQSEEERQELERLRELWLSLLEREQRLELRLRELEGLREQEAAVRELESRVAAAAMETRLLELRVSALQEENGRLRAQVEELDAARAELARAKEKLRAVKARVQGEQEEAAALRARVEDLERGREERTGALAAEAAALREANSALEEENVELALQLQDAELAAASSVNLVIEEDMVEEANYLRETNERLTRQIEELRSDHCAHVEELVYLKWVNACLRHELRDHDPSSEKEKQDQDDTDGGGAGGLSSAMELSKSMSFRSSERAKQLMLRYGHPGGLEAFDPALFSPLHESVDGGDGDERPGRSSGTSVATTTMADSAAAAPRGKKAGQRKLKFLGNIKKLLPGGSKRSHQSSHGGRDGRNAAPRDEYLEKAMQWLSAHDVLDGVGDHSYESTPLSSCDRTPLSSVTTATTRGGGGGGGCSERGAATNAEVAEPAALPRSKSDAGASYGREASRYHALRPDHPAEVGGGPPDGFRRAPEKSELRRRSEELRRPEAAYVRTGIDMHAD